MKHTPPLRLVCALTILASTSSYAALSFQTIDMAALGKGNDSFITPTVPIGSPTILGGVPFIVTSAPNQVWSANNAAGGGHGIVSVNFPMAVNNIQGFYTLANLFWGNVGLKTTQYRFDFDDSTSVSVLLENGVDLRDFNNATWANTINGTTTVNVAQDPYRMDRQWIDLAGLGYGGKNLVNFNVTDSGAPGVSRVYVVAATAQVGQIGQISTVPEVTSSIVTAFTAFAGLTLRNRRRR